jgi:hypothetical protein
VVGNAARICRETPVPSPKKFGGWPPEDQPPQQQLPNYLNHTDFAVRSPLLFSSIREVNLVSATILRFAT